MCVFAFVITNNKFSGFYLNVLQYMVRGAAGVRGAAVQLNAGLAARRDRGSATARPLRTAATPVRETKRTLSSVFRGHAKVRL